MVRNDAFGQAQTAYATQAGPHVPNRLFEPSSVQADNLTNDHFRYPEPELPSTAPQESRVPGLVLQLKIAIERVRIHSQDGRDPHV